MEQDLRQLRGKAYAAAYLGLILIFVLSGALYKFLPSSVASLPKEVLIAGMALAFWLFLLIKMVPRCPSCGMGLFSIIEIGRVPITVRSWVGDSCSRCGAALK